MKIAQILIFKKVLPADSEVLLHLRNIESPDLYGYIEWIVISNFIYNLYI